jgi:RNA polymerase sigma factor (sigma-70 family)
MKLTKTHLKDISAIAYNFYKTTGIDRNDLYQEAAIGYIKAAENYNNHSDASFLTYAHRCAVNNVIDFIRQEKELRHLPIIERDYKTMPSLTFMLYDAIEHLRTYYKTSLKLFMQGYTYYEIAQMLNIKVSTLKPLLHRAKKELKKI